MNSQKRIAIIGGGTMGSMTAWRLAEQGVAVTVFEQFGSGHDRSAAGGESRIFRTVYAEGPEYIPLLHRSRELWRELEKRSGRQLLKETGMLSIVPEHSNLAEKMFAGIAEYSLDCDVIAGSSIGDRFPQHAAGDGDVAILDQTAGFLRPELAVSTATKLAEDLGAQVRRHAKVDAIHPHGNGVTVSEGGRDQHFDTAVLTAGPWLARLLPQLNDIIDVQRRINAWYIPKTPEFWFNEDSPVFTRTNGNLSYYGIPSVDGISVKIGVTSELDDPVPDPDNLQTSVKLPRLASHREVLSEFLPDLNPDPIRIGAYQEAYTPDRKALVGAVPGLERLIIAGGFSGHGFKMSPCIGEIVAGLVTTGQTNFDVGFLSPGRFPDFHS